MKTSPVLLAALLSTLLTGCKASVSANAKAGTGKDGEEIADYDKPLSPQQRADQQGGPGGPAYALFGARHDLNYSGEPKEVCRCLAVAAGQPNDARFSWEAAVPSVDSGSQLVIALTSQSIACSKAKKDSLGASYQGYEVDGANVIVIVEAAKAGRPLTSGGIVPRPTGSGALFVRPASKDLPYGTALDTGAPRCRIEHAPTAVPVDTTEVFTRPFKSKEIKSADEEEEEQKGPETPETTPNPYE